jgi:ATP-dependent Zn protease
MNLKEMKRGEKMNKWFLWIIIILIVVGIGYMFFGGGDGGGDGGVDDSESGTIENAPDSEYKEVDSSDEILNELDASVEFLE